MDHRHGKTGQRSSFHKWSRRPRNVLLLLAVPLLCFWSTTYFIDWNSHGRSTRNSTKTRFLNLHEARVKAVRLQELLLQLESLHLSKMPPSLKVILELKTIADQLHHDDSDANLKSLPLESSSDCVQPVQELVTVIVNVKDVTITKPMIIQLIEDFQVSYPGIHIIARVNTTLSTSSFPNGTASTLLMANSTEGFWEKAVQKVETRYVLIAPDIYRFSGNTSSLERLIGALANTPGISAVGGSTRNDSGHWMLGCYQTTLKNYVLEYDSRYHFAQNRCVLCDYIDGPFLMETALLERFLPDEGLETGVVFQDLFLRLSGHSYGAMVCPDVMFYGKGNMGASNTYQEENWLSMAYKWELNRIVINQQSSRVLLKFSCATLGISCAAKVRQTSSYTIPTCCQEEFAGCMAFWDQLCRQHGVQYMFDSGTCLGAVKMSDFIQWDIDGDGGYHETNYTFIKNQKQLFKQNGFLLKRLVDPVCCDKRNPNHLKRSFLELWSPSMKIEMWGDWNIPFDVFLDKESTDASLTTIMEIHGVWVKGPTNPGHYARKRYGHECLRHAQSWSQTGKKSSWEPYQPGTFKTCENHSHHSCLDKFPKDGSIAFLVPN